MNWRNPSKELPKQGQKVWVMLEPQKGGGWSAASPEESMRSIQILCGEASSHDDTSCRMEKDTERGGGTITWNSEGDSTRVTAWVPIKEMMIPAFK